MEGRDISLAMAADVTGDAASVSSSIDSVSRPVAGVGAASPMRQIAKSGQLREQGPQSSKKLDSDRDRSHAGTVTWVRPPLRNPGHGEEASSRRHARLDVQVPQRQR